MPIPGSGGPMSAKKDLVKTDRKMDSTDIVIVGAGAAGFTAAITAHDAGAKIILLEKQPLTGGKLREQLGRLGTTPFKLGRFKNLLAGEVMLPVSELNRLRREVVAELERARAKPPHWKVQDCQSPIANYRFEAAASSKGNRQLEIRNWHLIALVRNVAQLEAALKCGVETVYCDFDNPKKYRDAVTLFHTTHDCSAQQPSTLNHQPAIFVAPPRIFKPGEEWILNQVRSCNADGYLVRNYDHLHFFAGDRCIGDYSLNIANRLAADYFKNKFGLERVTASSD